MTTQDDDVTRAMQDLDRHNAARLSGSFPGRSSGLDPVTLAAISGLVSIGSGAVRAWLDGSDSPEERERRIRALGDYAAIAPPQHGDIIAQAAPGQPVPKDMEPEEPPEPPPET